MASTYVNDLRLNEMATGDASGSWGTVTNTNLELIGEAFSYGTETIGDADSTLTIADGAADAARSFYLKITSSVDLTTTRIVTLGPNTVSKVWMIENATTGSQVITIKQGSGATINVPNGQVKMISTDGAGSGGAVLDLLVDVDLTGTTTLVNLDVSGAVDIAGDLTLSAGGDGALRFTAASSVKVLDNNAAALVFEEADNAYMTFVTTDGSEAVKFDKALDINAATQIDATVTVGVDDTGYDVKFFGATAGKYMLWDESADTLEVSGTVVAAAGTALLPSITTTGDLNTGMWFPAADTIAFSEGGVEALRIDSSGNVGIGTSSPATAFEVNGVSTGEYLRVGGGTLSDRSLRFSNFTVASLAGVGHQINVPNAYGVLAFATGSTERLRIDASGNVGIGTTSPAHKLTVAGYSNVDAANKLAIGDNADYQALIYMESANETLTIENTSDYAGRATIFKDNGTERMRIDASGNLLVGHTSQDFPVDDGGAGVTLRPTGVMLIGGTGTSIYANREDSDGEIIQFRKDGTTVGSIGTISGNLQFMSGSVGVGVGDDNLYPTNGSGNSTDATLDIGDSAARFKDLYLSGGVYLGGTVAANHLDDYEEGTWTPFITASSTSPTVTHTIQVGYYTKIGRQVTAYGVVSISAISGGSGDARIGGLPFAASAATQTYPVGTIGQMSGFTSTYGDVDGQGFVARVNQSGTTINILESRETSTVDWNIATNIGATFQCRVAVTYFVD
jgi:hypothetical protein